MIMMLMSGTTKSVISARVGDQLGSGKVEIGAPQWDESLGELTIKPGNPVDVLNIHEVEIPAGVKVAVAFVDGRLTLINFDRKCAVQIPGMGSVYFLTELPTDTDGLEIELGAWIDIAPNVYAMPPGTKPPEQVLCRSTEDPKHYKLYRYRREIEGTDYEETGLMFGGTFTAESWERFHGIMASFSHLDRVAAEEGQ
jgi:hypothetical protein